MAEDGQAGRGHWYPRDLGSAPCCSIGEEDEKGEDGREHRRREVGEVRPGESERLDRPRTLTALASSAMAAFLDVNKGIR